MKRLIVSLSGEGKGHAARTLSLLEMLREFAVTIFAPEHVRQWLEKETSSHSAVQFVSLPSLSFQYHRNGRLSYTKSWIKSATFLKALRSNLKKIAVQVERLEPDLVVTDFEPLLPRVAGKLKVPHLSLDHQHFLEAIDVTTLPRSLKWKVRFLRPSVRLFCPKADRHLVSSFYEFPQRKSAQHFQQIGVLLREDLGRMPSQVGEHLLVYVRRSLSAHWLTVLSGLSRPCVVYGFDAEEQIGNLQFRRTSNHQFLADLTSCHALVTTAGNQLVGEALSVGKPVLAIPEAGNFEQSINGYFLQKTGMGACVSTADLCQNAIDEFLERVPVYRDALAAYSGSGNQAVEQTIRSMLHPLSKEEVPDETAHQKVSSHA